MPYSDEQLKIMETRTRRAATLIQGGAVYVRKGEDLRLEVVPGQIEKARDEMENEFVQRATVEKLDRLPVSIMSDPIESLGKLPERISCALKRAELSTVGSVVVCIKDEALGRVSRYTGRDKPISARKLRTLLTDRVLGYEKQISGVSLAPQPVA
jgi:hypothetical protein